mmetsp:Transcript_13488/g.19038  ORF Transcript_13488/g.19038 Transcript_13488/m.19038 type:complete len:81 (-) Transcript_13488:57-299(-)
MLLYNNLLVMNLSIVVMLKVSLLVLADNLVMLLFMNVLTGLKLLILNITIVPLQDILMEMHMFVLVIQVLQTLILQVKHF